MSEQDDRVRRQMDFIIEHQAQFSVDIQKLQEVQTRTESNLAELTQQVTYMARQQAHINDVLLAVVESQQHTDNRLNALIDFVVEGRDGKS